MTSIKFRDKHGSISLLLTNLTLFSTRIEILEMLKQNGIENVIGLLLEPETQQRKKLNDLEKTWAICIFLDPTSAQKALSKKNLVPGNAVVSKRVIGYEIPGYICEKILNHYFPLQWSSEVSFEVLSSIENAPTELAIIVKIFSVSSLIETYEKTVILSEQEDSLVDVIKLSCEEARTSALRNIEIFLEDGQSPQLRNAQS